MKKRYTTYETLCKLPLGGSLWGLLFFFIFTACQDEIPNDTTEVMMTFTTRAFVGAVQGDTVSNSLNEEKMKDLRVIMVREDGEIVGNHKVDSITQTSVTFTFRTPVKTGGENFNFFAIANEGSVTPAINTSLIERAEGNSYSSDDLASFKALRIGSSAFTLSESQPIPQTKQWTIKVPQQDTKIDNQRLEYVASKISVEFHNETNKSQTLKNIKLTGIPSTTSGYLFKQETDDFVGTQQDASDIVLVGEEGMTLSVAQSDSVKYYTYPVGTLSSPTLVATWGDEAQPRTLALDGITSLPRNQQLKIIVTLTGQELTVNYTIAPWEEHATNIGSPTTDGGYDVKDWDDGNDVVIGEEDESGGDEPEEPGGGDTPIDGSVLWSGEETLNWTNLPISCEAFNDLGYDVTTSHKIRISFNATTANDATLQFLYGDETTGMGIPELNNSNSTTISAGTTSFEFSISEAMLSNFIAKEDSVVAFYVRGYQITITEVLLYLPETQ